MRPRFVLALWTAFLFGASSTGLTLCALRLESAVFALAGLLLAMACGFSCAWAGIAVRRR